MQIGLDNISDEKLKLLIDIFFKDSSTKKTNLTKETLSLIKDLFEYNKYLEYKKNNLKNKINKTRAILNS